MRRLICALLRLPLVWLYDSDGEETLRLAHRREYRDAWIAHRHGYGIRTTTLAPDGTCPNGLYVKTWCPANSSAYQRIPYTRVERPK